MNRKTPRSWYTLAGDCIGARTPSRFSAEFAGLDCYQMSHFWSKYLADTGFNRKDLLWTFDFAANYYKNMIQHADKWETSEDTFRDTVFDVLEYLEPVLDEVLALLMKKRV